MPNCSRWNNSKAPAASLARIGPAMTYLMWIPWSCPKRCGCNVLLPPYTHHINTWNQSQSFSQSFPWQVALYCTGFPCTPYSRLHANSQLLGEEAAKPMWKCIQNIRDARPAVSCHQCTMLVGERTRVRTSSWYCSGSGVQLARATWMHGWFVMHQLSLCVDGKINCW